MWKGYRLYLQVFVLGGISVCYDTIWGFASDMWFSLPGVKHLLLHNKQLYLVHVICDVKSKWLTRFPQLAAPGFVNCFWRKQIPRTSSPILSTGVYVYALVRRWKHHRCVCVCTMQRCTVLHALYERTSFEWSEGWLPQSCRCLGLNDVCSRKRPLRWVKLIPYHSFAVLIIENLNEIRYASCFSVF